jgi:hypothetical protein
VVIPPDKNSDRGAGGAAVGADRPRRGRAAPRGRPPADPERGNGLPCLPTSRAKAGSREQARPQRRASLQSIPGEHHEGMPGGPPAAREFGGSNGDPAGARAFAPDYSGFFLRFSRMGRAGRRQARERRGVDEDRPSPRSRRTIPSSANRTRGAARLFDRPRIAGPRCVSAIRRARSSSSLASSSRQLRCPSAPGSALVHSQISRSAPSARAGRPSCQAVSPLKASSRPSVRMRRCSAPSSGLMCLAADVLTRRPAARPAQPGGHSR